MSCAFGFFSYFCNEVREKDSRAMLNSNSNCDLDKEFLGHNNGIRACTIVCRLLGMSLWVVADLSWNTERSARFLCPYLSGWSFG